MPINPPVTQWGNYLEGGSKESDISSTYPHLLFSFRLIFCGKRCQALNALIVDRH